VRLTRLELAGFKTFADRTQFEFAPRITAIVGPNGSGKSNIFDAVRWALGEGSLRALRGVRNEDVIFAGSETRRPLAMAEVTLTLDNTEGALAFPNGATGDEVPTPLAFAEVTVTRRALRGADSQYLINGLPCRLRDIQTMFLGTGLGGHSYALITQGEVDHMLEASPEERRMILEEAAGLARYKRRRHEAERRMGAADQLLLRVADILGEQETHVAQLAGQAEAAREYQAYTQELQRLELAVQIEEVRRLARAQKRVRDHLDQVGGRRREVEDALGALAQELGALDRRTAEAGREWETVQRTLMRLTEKRTAEDASAQLIAERCRGVASDQERVARELDRFRGDAAFVREERTAVDRAAADLAGACGRIDAEVADTRTSLLQTEAELARSEELMEKRRDEARSLAADRAQIWNELAAADARLLGCRDRIEGLSERLSYLRRQHHVIEGRRRDVTAEVAQIISELEAKRKTASSLRDDQKRQAAERDDLLADLRLLELDRETVRSRLGYLEDAHAQYRGYDAGARELLLARQTDPARFATLRGAAVEFLSVPRDLRRAVEAALGPFLSALVVDSVEDARALSAHLAGRHVGDVAFLPSSLARAREMSIPAAAASDAGLRGRALDLVQVTTGGDASRALLADLLIVQDLDAALRIRTAGYAGRIATLAGEALSPEGVLTTGPRGADDGSSALQPEDRAGSAGRDRAEWRTGESPLGRAEEIAETRASLSRLEEVTREHSHRGNEATERLREIEGAIADADAKVARQIDVRADAQRRLTLLDAEASRLNEEMDECVLEQQAAEEDAAAQERLQHTLAAQAGNFDARITALETEAQALSAHLRHRTDALREIRDRITDLKVSLTELEGKRTALAARGGELDRSLAQITGREEEMAREAERLDAERARLLSEEEAARARGAVLGREAASLEQTLGALDSERAGIAARKTEVDAQHRDTAARAEALSEEAHRIELRQAQVDAEMGSARRRIEEEFGRPFDQAAAQAPDSIDKDEALGRTEALRGLIAALGPVNLLAIEEHRMASERTAALKTQYDDVRGAIAALRSLIAHLEGVIRTRFDETFRAVNAEFATLFTRLFGGGRAGLELVAVEGSDEPGIDIAVQLPGKNLRSLGALSGGERVMVALALIFAMLRVRPSPFCVFDEVEAALDEPNTRKVAEVLRELAEQTQIIIITHNKATMEACDVLFGVTMEEPGISHMVSMRLQERDGLREGQPVG
jgi:chromosome segregation protein